MTCMPYETDSNWVAEVDRQMWARHTYMRQSNVEQTIVWLTSKWQYGILENERTNVRLYRKKVDRQFSMQSKKSKHLDFHSKKNEGIWIYFSSDQNPEIIHLHISKFYHSCSEYFLYDPCYLTGESSQFIHIEHVYYQPTDFCQNKCLGSYQYREKDKKRYREI